MPFAVANGPVVNGLELPKCSKTDTVIAVERVVVGDSETTFKITNGDLITSIDLLTTRVVESIQFCS